MASVINGNAIIHSNLGRNTVVNAVINMVVSNTARGSTVAAGDTCTKLAAIHGDNVTRIPDVVTVVIFKSSECANLVGRPGITIRTAMTADSVAAVTG